MKRALCIAAVLSLAACGGGDDDATTTTAEPTTTTAPTTTTTEATTTTPAPACPTVPVVAIDAGDLTEASADVDGDGADDTIRAFADGEGAYSLHVDLAAGGGAKLVLPADGVTSVAVIGGFDVDDDGAEEIWARTGAGASATILGLFQFADCALAQVTFADGSPAEMPVGGSIGTASGVECAAPGLITHTASNVGGDSYEVSSTGYALEGGVLVEKTGADSAVTVGEPAFDVATSLTCGDLVL